MLADGGGCDSIAAVDPTALPLPADLAAAHAMILAERQARLAAAAEADRTQAVRSFQRRRPVRKPFPDDIPRERVVIAAPTCCPCCGGHRLSKLGEDITETLDYAC